MDIYTTEIGELQDHQAAKVDALLQMSAKHSKLTDEPSRMNRRMRQELSS